MPELKSNGSADESVPVKGLQYCEEHERIETECCDAAVVIGEEMTVECDTCSREFGRGIAAIKVFLGLR